MNSSTLCDLRSLEVSEKRAKILNEARSFIGTKYHHAGAIKGVGVDCLTFIYLTYLNAGMVKAQKIPFYRPDFMLHGSEETYLLGLLEQGSEVDRPLPADIAIFKWGRIFAHAGIVTSWPKMLHAHPTYGVIEMDGTQGKLRGREVKFISAFDDRERA